ncbi:MAG: hypothetical protein U9N13_00575 [Euryarchaeota archaeon]|nr:hypothetical protein [Euryarchaeota archaeon]
MNSSNLYRFCAISLMIVMICTGTAVAFENDDIEWLEPEEHTLYWGDKINTSGYLISASDFSLAGPTDSNNDYVMLSILTDRSEEWSSILALNTSEIPSTETFNDRLKIEALEVVTGNDIEAPYATIGVSVANISTTTYTTTTWINSTLTVKRTSMEGIYIDERAYFLIEIENLKPLYLNRITINETLPENLVMDPDQDIGCNCTIGPHGKQLYRYSIKALRPGEYVMPATEVQLTHLGKSHYVYANTSNFTVHGPFINVTKDVSVEDTDGNGYRLNITVNVSNEGDRAAHVQINDHIPNSATVTEGMISDELVLYPSDTHILQYMLRIPDIEGRILPAAVVEFSDSKGYSGDSISKRIVLSADNAVSDETDVDGTLETEPKEAIDGMENVTGTEGVEDEQSNSSYISFGEIRSVKDIIDNTIKLVDELYALKDSYL